MYTWSWCITAKGKRKVRQNCTAVLTRLAFFLRPVVKMFIAWMQFFHVQHREIGEVGPPLTAAARKAVFFQTVWTCSIPCHIFIAISQLLSICFADHCHRDRKWWKTENIIVVTQMEGEDKTFNGKTYFIMAILPYFPLSVCNGKWRKISPTRHKKKPDKEFNFPLPSIL